MNPLETLAAEVPHLKESFDPAFVFGSAPFGMTQYVLWMIICFVITLIVVMTAAKRLTLVPTNKFAHMVEYGYDFVKKDMGESAIGHGYKKHLPFLCTMFFFILISNFIGLIPGRLTLAFKFCYCTLVAGALSFHFSRKQWQLAHWAEAEQHAHGRRVRESSYVPASAGQIRVH